MRLILISIVSLVFLFGCGDNPEGVAKEAVQKKVIQDWPESKGYPSDLITTQLVRSEIVERPSQLTKQKFMFLSEILHENNTKIYQLTFAEGRLVSSSELTNLVIQFAGAYPTLKEAEKEIEHASQIDYFK